jgi:hypothetical protein
VNRLFDDAQRKQDKLERKRLTMAREELETKTKDKPTINQKSARITILQQPMHQRFEKLIARKKQRMEKLERDLILKKIENDPDEYFASHKP